MIYAYTASAPSIEALSLLSGYQKQGGRLSAPQARLSAIVIRGRVPWYRKTEASLFSQALLFPASAISYCQLFDFPDFMG
jgi:hypothetical protein